MLRLQQSYPDTFSAPPNGTTALQAFRDGKIISPLGMEGLHSIGNSLALLRDFHARGVAYATLTHNCHNRYADAALVEIPGGIKKADPLWHGVSEAGKTLVHEMNRLGILIDLSHASDNTSRAAIELSSAPVIWTHSAARSLVNHQRNIPDDILHLIGDEQDKNRGIVHSVFYPPFLAANGQANISSVVDHVEYIASIVGKRHVGIGSDFDGMQYSAEGLEDVTRYPALVSFNHRQLPEEALI